MHAILKDSKRFSALNPQKIMHVKQNDRILPPTLLENAPPVTNLTSMGLLFDPSLDAHHQSLIQATLQGRVSGDPPSIAHPGGARNLGQEVPPNHRKVDHFSIFRMVTSMVTWGSLIL